ncbi:MAG: sensor domain-containing diguanylate cyclase [Chloroflexi bacterium]|nr:sensor domain-containing diguanylate cyclase [Chloroflexota bacterium]
MLGSRYRSLDSAETLRDLVRNLPEGIYITNPNGDILDVNQAFLDLFGVASLDDLRSCTAIDLLVDPAARACELEMLARDGRVRDFELQIRRPDGEVRTVIDTAYVCRDPDTGEIFYHGILTDITTRKELEGRLREQSHRDPLTGCYNRRYLEQLAQRIDTTDQQWGCIVIDVDYFKAYNDQYGHQVGDETLIRLSRFLLRHTRAGDAVVRMGGDEFLVMLPGADLEEVRLIADRLGAAAMSQSPAPFSLGSAARRHRETIKDLVGRADRRLLAVRVQERTADPRRQAM